MNNQLTTTNQNAKSALLKAKSYLDLTKKLTNYNNGTDLINKNNNLYFILTRLDWVSNNSYIYVIVDADGNIKLKEECNKILICYPYFITIHIKTDCFLCIYDQNFDIIKKIENEYFKEIYTKYSILITKIDKKTKIWDLNTLEEKKVFDSDEVYCFSKHIVVSKDNKINLWDAEKFTHLFELENNDKYSFRNFFITENNRYLICHVDKGMHSGREVLLWDLTSGKYIHSFNFQSNKSRILDGYSKYASVVGTLYDEFVIVDNDDYEDNKLFTIISLKTYKDVYSYWADNAYINYTKKYIVSIVRGYCHYSPRLNFFNIENKNIITFDGCRHYQVTHDNLYAIILNPDFNLQVFSFSNGDSNIILKNEKIHSFLPSSDNKTIIALTVASKLLQIDYIEGKIVKVFEDIILDAKSIKLYKLSTDNKFLIVKEYIDKEYRDLYTLWNLEKCKYFNEAYEIDFIDNSKIK